MASMVVPGKITVRFMSGLTVEQDVSVREALTVNGIEIDLDPKNDGAFILTVPIGSEREWVTALENHPHILSAERYSEKLPSPTR